MTISARRYTPADAARWDAFVRASRNGTFLFERGYMDYHADRFEDASLLIHDDATLLAVLPASRSGEGISSHGGLTYGGFVYGDSMTTARMLEVFDAVAAHCRAEGVRRVLYKTVPSIYPRYPSEEDRYALFRADAPLVRRDVLAVVPAADRLAYQERRRRGVKKARAAGVEVTASDRWADFWGVLDANLRARHGVGPVHSLEEIKLLYSRFPDAIRLFVALDSGGVVAGAVLYDTPRVAHVQYISASDRGRELHALDALFDHLLSGVYADKQWFDFGISNEDGGRMLNVGLIEQKEGFGARAVAHDFYEWSMA